MYDGQKTLKSLINLKKEIITIETIIYCFDLWLRVLVLLFLSCKPGQGVLFFWGIVEMFEIK